jgi:hypothetical protein
MFAWGSEPLDCISRQLQWRSVPPPFRARVVPNRSTRLRGPATSCQRILARPTFSKKQIPRYLLATPSAAAECPLTRRGESLQSDPYKELAGRSAANSPSLGAWLSLVERYVRDVEVARSNRVAPTIVTIEPFGEYVEGLSLCGV